MIFLARKTVEEAHMTTPRQLPHTSFTACNNVNGAPHDQKMAVDVFVLYSIYFALRDLLEVLLFMNQAARPTKPR